MSRILKTVLWSALAALVLVMVSPAPASAVDRYWPRYWGWYDREYRPYVHRYYHRHHGYDRDYFDRDYDGRDYSRYRTFRYPYQGRYYYRPGGRVQIGPFGIYWY